MEVAVQFIGESIPIIDRDNNQFLGVVTEADLFRDYLSLQNKMVDLERR
jgi:CIC family chloride channel protein